MMRARFVWWMVALAVVGVGAYLLGARSGGPPATQAVATARYHCPMHPSYVSDKPGDCPICGMKLVPIQLRLSRRVSASFSTTAPRWIPA
jgi:hypothetical protein